MGETMAEPLRDPIEIEKPNPSEAAFKQSISFGRFENDLLSWERWSSFSQNKYLEEVGKCSTPGSVAKKKAYFEAHYKKIAARKAEMDQEQEMEDDSYRSGAPTNGNPIGNGCSTKLEFDTFCLDGVTTSSTEPDNNLLSVANTTSTEEPEQDAIGVNCQGSFVEKVEVDDLQDSPKSSKFEGAVLVKDDNVDNEPQDLSEELFELIIDDHNSLSEQSEQVDNLVQEENDLIDSQVISERVHRLDNETNHVPENKKEDAKSKPQREPQKKTLASKDKNLVKTKKKSVTPTTKTPVAATPKTTRTSLPRASKLTPTSTVISASKSSTRKESSASLLMKSNPSAAKKKASTPNSMHMSLTLGPSKSDLATPAPARRSFIMEKMGDKDIVKRAFRAFQNNFSLSNASIEEKSTPQQISTKKTARVASTSLNPQNDKERAKVVEDTSSQKKQVGARPNSSYTSSQKKQVGARPNSVSASRPVSGADRYQSSAKVSQPSLGVRSDVKAEKGQEISKKLEKSNAKEVDRPRLRSQSKEKKEADTKKLSKSLDIKATATPDLPPGQRASKTHGNKVGRSNEIPHQLDSRR